MSPDPTTAGSEGIALALAFARAPSQFPELLHGRRRLPPGVTALLKVAAGSPLADAESALAGAVSGEPQQAAQFFIEQVLLAHSADHYRVLGVDPTAPAEQIKEHHRLLIRLFHPDRQQLPDARTAAFATRINLAYIVLRSPDTRANYDLELMKKHAGRGAGRHAGLRQSGADRNHWRQRQAVHAQFGQRGTTACATRTAASHRPRTGGIRPG